MHFVSSLIRLNGRTISMYLPDQLAWYVSPETEPHLRFCSASNFSISKPFPDIVVFRRTMYFEIALKYDLSLNENSYTQALSWINNSSDFNKIYSSATFETYQKLRNNIAFSLP